MPMARAARGRNGIERTLDGCVIVKIRIVPAEAGAPALRGLSVSTWDPRATRWKQTWVDNTGPISISSAAGVMAVWC